MEKLVSVIMSTYKTNPEYLDLAINSILKQTYKKIEFIIVCDGDKAEYEYIKNKYKDERIKLILHNENKGLPYSLNEAIKISNGDYIARMDSDDISRPDRLKTQVAFMNKHKNIKILGMFCRCFGQDNLISTLFLNKSKEIQIQLLYRACFTHPTIMIEREYLIKNNFQYNENYKCSQDFELWSNIVTSENSYVIPKIGLNYRIHANQATIAKRTLQVDLTKKIIENNLKKYKISNEFRDTMYVLGELEEINKLNYIKVNSDIKKIIKSNSQYFDKRTLRKVLYNRYFQLIIKSPKIKLKELLKNISTMHSVIHMYNLVNIFFVIRYKILLKYLLITKK